MKPARSVCGERNKKKKEKEEKGSRKTPKPSDPRIHFIIKEAHRARNGDVMILPVIFAPESPQYRVKVHTLDSSAAP